eukprot:1655150-Lingulodinium_polyedra.AAC.1
MSRRLLPCGPRWVQPRTGTGRRPSPSSHRSTAPARLASSVSRVWSRSMLISPARMMFPGGGL